MKRSEIVQPEVGERFGHWVITAEPRRVNGDVRYPCRCDCGEERLVVAITLRNGSSTSCGCMRSGRTSKHQDLDGLQTSLEIQRIFDLISQGILPPADQFTFREGEPTWSFSTMARILGVSPDEFRGLLKGVGPRFENENLAGGDEFQAFHAAGMMSYHRNEPA